MPPETETIEQVTNHRNQLKGELDALNPKHNALEVEARGLREELAATQKKLADTLLAAQKAVDEANKRGEAVAGLRKAVEELQSKLALSEKDRANALANQAQADAVNNQVLAIVLNEANRKARLLNPPQVPGAA